MPQPTQHSLIHILLLWTTILSIIQAVFIILFFTSGHIGPSQNSSAVTSLRTVQSQANNTSSWSSPALLGEGRMVTYVFREKDDNKWATGVENDMVSVDLMLLKDGYYFLNLQVTLKTCNNITKTAVTMKYDNRVLLHGWINPYTCSTGLLGKVEVLSAGYKLEFILPPHPIDDTEYVTHMDIIYISNHKGRL